MIEWESELGARAARRLREEAVVWLTTVTERGAPLPSPVWFIWDGKESILIYSLAGARVRNLAVNPRVTLNFDGDGKGGDIVIFAGAAARDPDVPAADANPDYLAKYARAIERVTGSAESFAARYSVPVRVSLERLRGH